MARLALSSGIRRYHVDLIRVYILPEGKRTGFFLFSTSLEEGRGIASRMIK